MSRTLFSLVPVFTFPFLFALTAQTVEVVEVRSQAAARTLLVPGEILPFQRVTLRARASGYVERVLVDRGSTVRRGQLLLTISAPELAAETAEAQARLESAEAARAEAEARLAAVQAIDERLRKAAETPGAIAGNELVQASKNVEAAQAALRSAGSVVRAARSAVETHQQAEAYLRVTAPFAGTITERLIHPGALAGPETALLELEQVSRLRVVVAVPEAEVAGIRRGARVTFRVPAFRGRTFAGTVARVDRSLDPKTRTMPVELDVNNPRGELAPGMYAEVDWPAGGAGPSLMAPRTAVVTTTERTFVIRVRGGVAEWVNVRRGAATGDWVEVLGPLSPGDLVVRRATDEIRDGARLSVRRSS